jgi:transcriptional regulator with XRE-family HTH domain
VERPGNAMERAWSFVGISPSEFLLRELRRRRTAAGMTQTVLGERLFCSDSQVSAIETGTKPPTLPYLRAVDGALDTGDYFVTLWEELVKDGAPPVWLRDWLEIEREATALRWYEPAYVPGLLQTCAYARAALTTGRLSITEIDQRVETRMERQAVLTRDPAPQVFVVCDEMVIRRTCGSASVMAEQLEHLVSCAEQPNIQMRIVPASLGMYEGLAGAFIIADLPDATRAGYVDNQLSAQIIEQPESIASLGLTWEALSANALPRGQTLDLLKEAAKTWR